MPKITKKNCQKWQWNTKNILQFDPFSCWQPGIQPTYLVSTQKWPKNSQKMAKTAQKLKKLLKKGDFAQQNLPLRNDFFRLFSHPSSWPVREVRFGPPNFDRGLKTRISSNDHRAIKNDHYYRNWANGLSHISNYIAIEQ